MLMWVLSFMLEGLTFSVQSLSTISRQVTKLTKLTHLDISRSGFSTMPSHCSWPFTLRYLNISRAKLSKVTDCLPTTLEVKTGPQSLDPKENWFHVTFHGFQVLDLSNNNLKDFRVILPSLRELHLSGNKFLRFPDGRLFQNLQMLEIQVQSYLILL